MNELIEKIEQWAKDKGLDTADSSKQMLKVMEELGEVAAAIVRSDRASLRDGIGDSVVTLIILAMQNDMDLFECLNYAYDEIKDRTGEMVNGTFVKSSDLTETESEDSSMAAIIEETQARINYTDEFLEKGTLAELLRDKTFQELVEKEREKLQVLNLSAK